MRGEKAIHGSKVKDRYPNGVEGFIGRPSRDSMGFLLTSHVQGMGNHACRACRLEMGLPVGRLKEDKVQLPSDAKRPPKEVQIKDVETALHNLFCQDIGKNRNGTGPIDLFDSHRKAANTLIAQLKLQGIKLVPDPDFEDKPKVCRHLNTMTVFDNAGAPFKNRKRTGYKCIECKATANFS